MERLLNKLFKVREMRPYWLKRRAFKKRMGDRLQNQITHRTITLANISFL